MNIEIANRLVNYRKQNGLSQEQLAEKIGVSRQAVSKWERSEASPDTDNLILLARLYNVSIDDLLSTNDEIPEPEVETAQENSDASGFDSNTAENDASQQYYNYEHRHGIHIDDGDDHVHIDSTGIHVQDKKDEVHVTHDGVYVNGEKKDWSEWNYKHSAFADFPFAVLVVAGYLLIGFMLGGWWWGWLLFLTIPVFHGTVHAIKSRKLSHFPYEVCVLIAFLSLGLFFGWWHPAWALFLTIPLYRWFVNSIKRYNKAHQNGIYSPDYRARGCTEESYTTESGVKVNINSSND